MAQPGRGAAPAWKPSSRPDAPPHRAAIWDDTHRSKEVMMNGFGIRRLRVGNGPSRPSRCRAFRYACLRRELLRSCAPAMARCSAATPSRVVSVGGAITEIILCARQRTAWSAATSTSIYPEAATSCRMSATMRRLAPEGSCRQPTANRGVEGSGPPETLAVPPRGEHSLHSIPRP